MLLLCFFDPLLVFSVLVLPPHELGAVCPAAPGKSGWLSPLVGSEIVAAKATWLSFTMDFPAPISEAMKDTKCPACPCPSKISRVLGHCLVVRYAI